jgi:hypothetical protein
MANAAILDSQTGIVLTLQDIPGDIGAFQTSPGTYAVAAPVSVQVGDQYNNPSDGAFAPAATVPANAKNALAIRQQANTALTRLRQIRDAPQITIANLAAVQALQTAVQDEAKVLIGLVRQLLGQFDSIS